MAPRKKVKNEYEEDEDSGSDYAPDGSDGAPSDGGGGSGSDEDYLAEERAPKAAKKKAAAKKAAPKRKAAAKVKEEEGEDEEKLKAKKGKAAKVTEPTSVEGGWVLHPPSLIYKEDEGAQGGRKVACFDLDGTLVGVKSGRDFPKDAHDWKWFNKQVPATLAELHEEGYQLLIVSNQGSIKGALNGAASEKARGRVDDMLAALHKKAGEEIPVQVLMATQKDENRKPQTGMWDFFVQNLNAGVAPDLSQSFFVGDMAGRPADVGDGTASDREFASAVGLPFFVPEDKFGPGDLKVKVAAKEDTGLNSGLVTAFEQLADMYSGEPFKKNAFKKVAEAIAGWPTKITASKELATVKGVGKSSLAKIAEFLETGTLAVLSEAGITAGVRPVDKQAEVGLKFV